MSACPSLDTAEPNANRSDWLSGEPREKGKRRKMKHRAAILLAVLCLAASWYYALCISSAGGVGLKPGHVNDFFQLWNASRAVLHHEDPYGPKVTEQNQIAAYGAMAKTVGMKDDRRIKYPIQATFPLLPLGLFEFRFADKMALCLTAALIALSVRWLRRTWEMPTMLYILLAFASYPVIVGLQMRQPTLFFFGLIVGSLALLRADRLTLSGILAALAAGKPQIALPVLLPMLVWTLARWQKRRQFAIAFAASLLTMASISLFLFPAWMPEWLSSLQTYPQYVHPSIAVFYFGNRLGLALSVALLIGLTATLWLHRECDLFFQAAISVVIFSLVIQSEIYNAVILLIPAVWVADNAHRIKECGPMSQLALAVVRIAFIELWLASAVGAVLLHTTPLGKSIAWHLSVDMVPPVILSLAAMMIVQCLTSSQPLQPTTAATPLKAQPN